MSRSKLTPGRRAKLYLQAHRDARLTGLPGEHREAREEMMRQLQREDPGVQERALVGSDRHFDTPLSAGEREYQRDWRAREGIDHENVLERRKQLDAKPTPAAGRGGGSRRPSKRSRRPIYTRRSRRRLPKPPTPSTIGAGKSAAVFAWDVFMAGVGLCLLYLILRPRGNSVITGTLGGIGTAFAALVSPESPLIGHAQPAAASSSTKPPTSSSPSTGSSQPRKAKPMPMARSPAPGVPPAAAASPLTSPLPGSISLFATTTPTP